MGNLHWEVTQDGEVVRMEMRETSTRRLVSWCEFPPEMGYELAQTITLNCIKCEEAKK